MGLEKLEAEPVLATVHRLHERIGERFSGRGLHHVAAELGELVQAVASSTASARGRRSVLRPLSRLGILAVVLVTGTVLVLATRAAVMDAPDDGLEWVPLLESAINDLVFAGLAIWFLFSVPERLQRAGLLDLLHRLRSLTHIVDMHQLTKDPERLRSSFSPTPLNPRLEVEPDQLEYYLEYCSELLSLIAKAAALCAEESRDQVVLDTVRSIETLTTGLDTTIRQKISVVDRARRELAADAAP